MADPAHEATRVLSRAAAQLAKLRWDLRSQAARADATRHWLDAATVTAPPPHPPQHPPPRAGLPPRQRTAASTPHARPQVLPPAAGGGAERRLRVVVSEHREVSLELESRIGVPAPEAEPRRRLAS